MRDYTWTDLESTGNTSIYGSDVDFGCWQVDSDGNFRDKFGHLYDRLPDHVESRLDDDDKMTVEYPN